MKLPSSAVGVIYAGGDGTRLWPISTKKAPKQVNPSIMKDTLLVQTYERARQYFSEDRIIIVTTEQIKRKIYNLVKLPKENYIVQPENADTAAAMGLTAMYLEYKFPNSVAVTLYSDHVISDIETFYSAIQCGISLAQKEKILVTIGTKPNYPNVQFGYIKKGNTVDEYESAYDVEQFTEKPDMETAQQFVSSGQYLWNTGLYIWEVNTLLSLFKQKAPEMYAELVKLRAEFGEKEYNEHLHDWYQSVEREAFDKAISEKAERLSVVEADYQWNDIGNWKTVYELSEKDENGNAILSAQNSRFITIDTQNCLVMPKQKTVSLIGVHDLIVVQTKDSLLICHKDHVHKVKNASQEAEKEV